MYQPPHFREDRLDVQHGLIAAFPLGTLVTVGPTGLTANHIPFLVDPHDGPFGALRAHVARANPVWRETDPDQEVLAIFQGSESYITPSWYETKRQTHKVVPTWNYAAVHVHGRMRAIEDEAWLHRQLADLTHLKESLRAEPWAVTDAPAPFVAGQVKGIVGLALAITRIEGKWKVSQNRPEADRLGVVQGLLAENSDETRAMAGLVEAFGRKPA